MRVTNEKNENIIEKKFHKSDFGDMWKDPLYKSWIDGLLEKALIRTAVSTADLDIDSESYEEMRALRDQLVGADIDPAAASVMLLGTLRGVMMQSLLDPEIDLAQVRDSVLAMAERSLARR